MVTRKYEFQHSLVTPSNLVVVNKNSKHLDYSKRKQPVTKGKELCEKLSICSLVPAKPDTMVTAP